MEDKLLSTQVYEHIKENIISLKYLPGTIIKEREIAESMGVSRTPVREALQRLTQECWVSGDGKKAFVREISKDDAREIEQIRDIVEFAAVDCVIASGSSRLLAGQLDAIINTMRHTSDQFAFMKLDMSFHNMIVANMENHRLLRFWDSIQEEVIRMGLLAHIHDDFTNDVTAEHEEFINALWSRESERVKVALRRHLEHCYESIRKNMI